MEHFIHASKDININGLENVLLFYVLNPIFTYLMNAALKIEAIRSSVGKHLHDYTLSRHGTSQRR